MRGKIMDVHSAGAQRVGAKTGIASIGRGFTQGGARRIKNCCRGRS